MSIPQKMNRIPNWAWGLAVLFAVFCIGWRMSIRHKRPPFELSFWYWHSPFGLTDEQTRDLKKLGVRQLFVRAGTFSSDGTNIVLVIPQNYKGGKVPFKIHQVFNFDSGVVRHFESYDLDRMAGQIATRIDLQVRRGQQAGLDIAGIQFDFDCPTRLLSRYADLVALVKGRLKSLRHPIVSATGLMSWLGSRGAVALSQQLDFMVPQAYEGKTGKTLADMRPVSDEEDFRRRIGLADGLACPFYVGLPAYGHGFLFDPQGNLLNIYRQIEPGEMMRHPAFKFISAFPSNREGHRANSAQDWVGEEILKFRAVLPARNGEGYGDTLGFTVPTPALLTKMLRAAREVQSPNCLGGIIYRMPQGESETTIPWKALTEALESKFPAPKLKFTAASTRDTFDMIESDRPTAEAPKDLNLDIENVGGMTFLSPDAVEVEVKLAQAGVDDVRSRDMNLVSTGVSEGDKIFDAPPSESNELLFRRSHLSPGQKVSIGPIRLLSSKRQQIEVRWKVRRVDGFGFETGKAEVNQ